MRTQVVWFKRDLRIHDHQPLTEACSRGLVLPLFIVEPDQWRQADASLRQWRFVRQSLADLGAALNTLGLRLIVRVGPAEQVLETLRRHCASSHPVEGVWSHEETGNAWTFARDQRVAAWAAASSVVWTEYRQDGVVRRLRDRNGYAAHWLEVMRAPRVKVPCAARPVEVAPVDLPLLPGSEIEPDPCPDAQPGGRTHALARIEHFLTERLVDYPKGMSSPLSAEHSCSRLSPHLAWGTVSMRELVQEVRNHRQRLLESSSLSRWERPLAAFEARLAWQSHFMQKLESEPQIEFNNMHTALNGLRDTVDKALLRAWARGETGYPLIDACMLMLTQCGWINFRMRAMLAAFASYHLWLPWRASGEVLARRFVDYEPGIHWSQMQMQSGSTGINAFRIYNPVKQSLDQDPRGIFIRRWVPALARVPAEWVHQPWLMPASLQARYQCVIGRDYPAPVVDHEVAARIARARLREAYQNPEARQISQAVLRRHGSRSGRLSRSSRTSAPRQTNQLDLFGD